MPELPEVETIRRGLSDFIVSQKIVDVEVLCEKSFIGPKEVVCGRTVLDIRRRGKALLIDLSGGVTMMIHLRMTGQLVYRSREVLNNFKNHSLPEGSKLQMSSSRALVGPPVVTGALPIVFSLRRVPRGERKKIDPEIEESVASLSTENSFAGGHPTDSFFKELPDKQTRVVFTLERGVLYFNDQRKFGFVKVLPTEEVECDTFIASLGPEPWEMKAEDLFAVFQRRKGSPVKGVILDQKVVAGIGNIYADEALFYAGIHPATACGELTLEDTEQILEGARKVMKASIDSGGSTMATYVRADGTKGDYLEKFAQVFRREGEPCPRCGCEIEKIRVVGRGTHICSHCQVIKGGGDD